MTDRSDLNEFGERTPIPPATGPDAGASPEAKDPFRWLTTPEWDRSPAAEFRREVEAIARDIIGGASSHERGGGPGGPEAGTEGAMDRDGFDIREGTPFRVIMLARAMAADVRPDAAGRPEASVTRDLALLEIARRRESSSLRLRRFLRLPPSTTSVLVDRLVAEGLIRRRPSPSDRRRRVLTLTEAGRARAAATAARWRELDERLLHRLSPDQRDTLRRLVGLAGYGLS